MLAGVALSIWCQRYFLLALLCLLVFFVVGTFKRIDVILIPSKWCGSNGCGGIEAFICVGADGLWRLAWRRNRRQTGGNAAWRGAIAMYFCAGVRGVRGVAAPPCANGGAAIALNVRMAQRIGMFGVAYQASKGIPLV